MIGPLVCLLFPALTGCTQYADYMPDLSQLAHRPAYYDGKSVDVQGTVERLNEWRSRAGSSYMHAFFICSGKDCVHVFLESASPIRNGDPVRVRGPYFRTYRSGKTVTHSEIEATEVLPPE